MKVAIFAVVLATAATSAFAYEPPNAYDNSPVPHSEASVAAPVIEALLKYRAAPTIEDLLGDLLDNDGRERTHHTPDTTVNPEEPAAPIVLAYSRLKF